MTTCNIDHSEPMALTDIKAWADLLTDSPPSAMLAGRSVCNDLREYTDEVSSNMWGMDVFAIADDEAEWVPGLDNAKMLLGSRKDIVGVLKWIGFLRTLPVWKREALIAIEKYMYNKECEEK